MMIAIDRRWEARPVELSGASAEDRRLLSHARVALQNSGYPSLGRLDCQVRQGIVSIDGVLPSFYLKQVAQEVLSRLAGVLGIRNLVAVEWPESTAARAWPQAVFKA